MSKPPNTSDQCKSFITVRHKLSYMLMNQVDQEIYIISVFLPLIQDLSKTHILLIGHHVPSQHLQCIFQMYGDTYQLHQFYQFVQ